MTKVYSSRQTGFTLLEVLVSIFVVLVGLLGVASMIPAGRFEMTEAHKADMGSNISRALLQSVVAQLNKNDKQLFTSGQSLIIYPNDVNVFSKSNNLLSNAKSIAVNSNDQGEIKGADLFEGYDDLLPYKDTDEKTNLFDGGTGDFIGFVTAIPQTNGYYEVTAAVSYKSRQTDDDALYGTVALNTFNPATGLAQFSSTNTNLERGQYVLVRVGDEIHWYRIEFAYHDGSTGYVTLSGPTWRNSSGGATMYVPGDVVAINSCVVRLGE